MNNQNQLPETRKVPDNVVPSGTELAVYTDIVANYELAIAAHVGCYPIKLAFRVYGDRLMWRLTWRLDPKLTRDEVRTVVWQATTKAFGAYKAELVAAYDGKDNHVVAVWFTNGVSHAQAHMQF